MANHKSSGFSPFSIFMILLLLAAAYNFTGCKDAKKATQITNKPNQAAMDVLRGRAQKPTNGRVEDQFIYRQIVALEFGHGVFAEAIMFFVRATPDCKDKPADQQTQDRRVVIGSSVLKELALILRSHWNIEKREYLLEAGSIGQKTRLVFEKDAAGKVVTMSLLRRIGGSEKTLVTITAISNTTSNFVFDHTTFNASYRLNLRSDETMSCQFKTDSNFFTENVRCLHLGQAENDESVILPVLEYSKRGDNLLEGEGKHYRAGKPLCPGDKAIRFVAPKNQTYITIFHNHQQNSIATGGTAKPAVVQPVATPTPSPSPRRRADVRGELEGADMPPSEVADAALRQMGQTTPVSTILDSPEALNALKIQAIHDKGEGEEAPGAQPMLDSTDLNGVDLK